MSHSHDHSQSKGLKKRPLLWSVAINLLLSVFQFIAGFISNSSALLADALHNTNDAAALVVAFGSRKISGKQANARFTFGYRRAELIGAIIQLTALIIIGLFLVYHAVQRFNSPAPIDSHWMILGSTIAILIDLTTGALLWATSKGSLNMRAVMLHNLSDAGSSIAVLAGGIALYFFGWSWIDPVLTLMIAGGIILTSYKLLMQTSRILMEATPEGVDLSSLKQEAENLTGVKDLHHVHVWEVDEDHRALEAHVVIHDEIAHRQSVIKSRLKDLFENRFEISHSTLEFERSSEACRGKSAKLVAAH
ncbi:cation diffusion facilitator family transporter [Pelagicoccus albus]|uniref:Cation transporter n=1 Tax=Pelagicoccus albus TaxID=415222 RepID=A0A7X1B6T2_9BACT|nr:cation diffusion facilitator family transporter [Pelagicoccus albus]MBC2606587.1 cation transporter [Pelagicoccus albus]